MNFFTQNQPFQFGENTYTNGGKYGPVIQEHITLFILQYGEAIVKADGITYKFSKNQAVLIYTESCLEVLFPRKKKHYVMWCHTGELKTSTEVKARLKSLPVSLPPSKLLYFLFREGAKLGHGHNINLSRLRNSMGATLFNEYFNQAHLEEEECDLHPAVWQAKRYLEENFHEPCTLDDAALAANINPRYLVQLFKKDLGMSPIKYLWHLRGEKAMYLLLQSGLTVSEIGYRCGFKTPHHFSRFIKDHYQYTPTQVRSNAWQRDPYLYEKDVPLDVYPESE